ncbi:hypothetical protein EC396_01240 [Lutibacter sp. HS1-25]|uniref:hypothetical protein n=1 Tax=Lutibacter sp. HS1-25 TaxID=2485000 RepID=UPI001011D991|nr:hypothetical protein [Lutibacter sp. HS1-25]RXP64624.1 hypothetical protein EC396_01240 [Lutibacter sp. HS1-25]
MNFELLEIELKKRLNYNYFWGRKQIDLFDKQTNFIYKIPDFETLLNTIESAFKNNQNFDDLQNYALNRWYNFWSAKAVESIFCEAKIVKQNPNLKDKYIDFYIENIPLDHKTTVFPKGFKKSIPYAINHKMELIEWLYNNQSAEQRKHFKNRIFVVLIDFEHQTEHWKLKAEILWLKKIISTYLSNFDRSKLQTFTFENKTVFADVIWAIK